MKRVERWIRHRLIFSHRSIGGAIYTIVYFFVFGIEGLYRYDYL